MSSGLPSWIGWLGDRQVPARALLAHGVELLLDATLPGKADISLRYAGGGRTTRDWPKGLDDRLKRLPRRAGLEPSGFSGPRKLLCDGLTERLLATRPTWQQHRVEADDLARTLRRVSSALSALPVSHIDGDARPMRGTEVGRLPQSLVAGCYRVLDSSKHELTLRAADADAVFLIGASRVVWVLEQRVCKFCFRLNLAGSKYCGEHCLSKTVGGDSRSRQRKYELGKVVARSFARSSQHEALTDLLSGTAATTMAARRLLWRAPVPNEDAVLRSLKRQLERSPFVLSAIGRDILDVKLLHLERELCKRLDPLNYRLGDWRARLRAAELWYRIASDVAPGVRGRGQSTEQLIQEALALARLGFGKSAVAERLAIHPSTISKWLSRATQHADVQELAACFQRAKANGA